MHDLPINRILLVSPQQVETLRRTRSRCYIIGANESLIETLLLQPQRSLTDMIPLVERAIRQSGLTDASGRSTLNAVMQPTATGLPFQGYIETFGWLANDRNHAFDMIIEVDMTSVSTMEPDITSASAQLNDSDMDNPLILITDVDKLTIFTENDTVVEPEPQREVMAARKGQETDSGAAAEGSSNRMKGKPGRVKDPSMDMRLKQNRGTMPRRPQETDNQGR